MPAQVVLFSDYLSFNPKPTRIYCDSNFLIRLLFYNDNASNPSILNSKDKDCYQFYTLLQQNNSELITSVYGFSELLHFYFFWYGNDGMYKVVKNYFARYRINLPNTSIHEKYKYFVRNHPTEFTAAFNNIAHRIAKAEEFFNQIGIKILYPLPFTLTAFNQH